MKKYGHTGTLFKRGKVYKWSWKHDYCIECLTCDAKHKGKGLCTRCFDKERRIKSENRRINLKKQQLVHYYKKRVKHFLNKKSKSKRGPTAFLTDKDKIIYKKQWYKENNERMKLQQKVKRRLKNGLPCLKIIINGKDVFLPFESLEKPTVEDNPEYYVWKEKQRQFDILTNFYRKKGQNYVKTAKN